MVQNVRQREAPFETPRRPTLFFEAPGARLHELPRRLALRFLLDGTPESPGRSREGALGLSDDRKRRDPPPQRFVGARTITSSGGARRVCDEAATPLCAGRCGPRERGGVKRARMPSLTAGRELLGARS